MEGEAEGGASVAGDHLCLGGGGHGERCSSGALHAKVGTKTLSLLGRLGRRLECYLRKTPGSVLYAVAYLIRPTDRHREGEVFCLLPLFVVSCCVFGFVFQFF